MAYRLPAKLGKAPVVEVTFEVRFSPAKESTGDVLIGLLYSKFPDYQKVETLPVAAVPRDVRDNDPNLRYLASHRLSTGAKSINVGDRVVVVSDGGPYQGWRDFLPHIAKVLDVVRQTGLAQTVERYSLKFVNVLPPRDGKQLEQINGRFEIAGRLAPEQGFRFRTEIVSGNFTTIIELIPNARTTSQTESREGLLVLVDTIRMLSVEDIWDNSIPRLDELHELLKSAFFELLTVETINSLDPVWEHHDLH